MKINICGDFTTKGSGINSVKSGTAFSSGILNLFSSADLNIVNLESPVVEENCSPIKKIGPALKTNKETISYLQKCRVGMVTLANNHFCDYGYDGVKETIESLDEYQIKHVGGGRNYDEIRDVAIFNYDDQKIALLNYCENEFSTLTSWGASSLDTIDVYQDLQKLKDTTDVRILIIHGGHEGYNLPSPRMKKLYRFFIDAGATVVINHHQHCFSGWEEYHSGYIFYGLGNFFFDSINSKISKKWNYGYICSLDISKSGGAKFQLLPYKQCLDVKSVILLDGEEKEKFDTEISMLNDIIKSDGSLQACFLQFCSSQITNIETSFSPWQNRILQALCRRNLLPSFVSGFKKLEMLNKLRCESHRDVAIEVFKK